MRHRFDQSITAAALKTFLHYTELSEDNEVVTNGLIGDALVSAVKLMEQKPSIKQFQIKKGKSFH